MKRLLLSAICVIAALSFAQNASAQVVQWDKIPVSQFESPDWPGRLVPADPAKMQKIDQVIPVRGLAIAAPMRDNVDQFCKFIEEELAPAHFNILVLRVDWNYAYESYPQLADPNPLTKADVKKIVAVCRKHGIQIAPQINLLGHQSWGNTTYALLREFPEFDETPGISTDDFTTSTPYQDGLYCKSYCPLHPGVHKVVFAVVDEICDAFESNWFHAGMDEVFFIGHDKCPRCAGIPKDKLYSDEVNRIHDHLAESNRRLMIWGDRCLNGSWQGTGIGYWEASMNNTYNAITMINKDVFICDWHYDYSGLTAIQFAFNGLDVALCPYTNPVLAEQHLNDMIDWRTRQLQSGVREHFKGIVHTVWSPAEDFLKLYYDPATYKTDKGRGGDARSLKLLISRFKELNK